VKASADGCGCFPTGRHWPGIAHLLRVQIRGLCEEFAPETPWHDMPVVLIDVETTGRDHAVDRIVEIGLIVGQHGGVRSRHNWLINPGIPIPEEVSKIHGITDDAVKDAPSFKEVASEILDILSSAIPAAYNASFDRAFVHEEMRRAGIDLSAAAPAARPGVEWVDPLVWARHVQREEKSKALGEVANRLGIKLENAHRASDDAEAALMVMYALGKDDRVPRTYGALIQEQRRLGRIQEEEFRVWRSRMSLRGSGASSSSVPPSSSPCSLPGSPAARRRSRRRGCGRPPARATDGQAVPSARPSSEAGSRFTSPLRSRGSSLSWSGASRTATGGR
jgi:DNA polymerase III subunit epsilon